MFTSASATGEAPSFTIPPTAATAVLQGDSIEEVRFLRDEMANMVWAIEHKLHGGTGEGLAGHERAVYNDQVDSIVPEPGPLLRYQLETPVPEHWIPMLPVAIDPVQGDIALERGVVVRARPDGTIFTLPARGRVLNPTGVVPYRVREEEVTRAGYARLTCDLPHALAEWRNVCLDSSAQECRRRRGIERTEVRPRSLRAELGAPVPG